MYTPDPVKQEDLDVTLAFLNNDISLTKAGKLLQPKGELPRYAALYAYRRLLMTIKQAYRASQIEIG